MATKLGLYNRALRILRERKLSALTDAVKARYALDDEYDGALDYMLEQGLWNFAARDVAAEAETSVEPEFGYDYAFEKPDDYVRLISMSAHGTFYPQLTDYREGPGYWYANANPLYYSYVSDGSSYGLNLADWPATFAEAFSYELARRIGPDLTSMSAAEARALTEDAMRALRDARTKDAMNQPAQFPQPGRLTTARGGARSNDRRWYS